MKHFPGCVHGEHKKAGGLPTPGDRQGLALGRVELHVPALLPISEPLEVFL